MSEGRNRGGGRKRVGEETRTGREIQERNRGGARGSRPRSRSGDPEGRGARGGPVEWAGGCTRGEDESCDGSGGGGVGASRQMQSTGDGRKWGKGQSPRWQWRSRGPARAAWSRSRADAREEMVMVARAQRVVDASAKRTGARCAGNRALRWAAADGQCGKPDQRGGRRREGAPKPKVAGARAGGGEGTRPRCRGRRTVRLWQRGTGGVGTAGKRIGERIGGGGRGGGLGERKVESSRVASCGPSSKAFAYAAPAFGRADETPRGRAEDVERPSRGEDRAHETRAATLARGRETRRSWGGTRPGGGERSGVVATDGERGGGREERQEGE